VNNTKESFNFSFNTVFPISSQQEEIFTNVAKEVVDSSIEGYNGTIFAYGQTGSGKTFTITGGAEHYEDRGIIPRTLAYIFSETSKKKDSFYEISVSYLEIYNNEGFDLLNESHTSKNLHDLPKVIPRETENEEIVLTGLSVHKAQNEEDALNLLFIGDTNRVVSETPKNDASTRSHCIFIIQIEAKKAGSDIKTVSRLHLVDLSGSERVGKTGIEGILFREATQINLSLHYLENCIVCLNKRSNGENIHVPYRNSLLTLVLRDSIGGNCKTRMIANISAENDDIEESIATCRFASRVAMIKNTVVRNESVDPALVIERLKRENAELKAELAMIKGGEVRETLNEGEVEECKKEVEEFIRNREPGVHLILSKGKGVLTAFFIIIYVDDRLKINECFYQFKHLYNDLLRKSEGSASKETSSKQKNTQNNYNKENQSNELNNEEIQK